MKKNLLYLTAPILLFSVIACDKEKTFEEKLEGEWHSVVVKENGINVADKHYTLELKSGNRFLYSFDYMSTSGSESGNWQADEAKAEIMLDFDVTGTIVYEIEDFEGDRLNVENVSSSMPAVVLEIEFER